MKLFSSLQWLLRLCNGVMVVCWVHSGGEENKFLVYTERLAFFWRVGGWGYISPI